MIKQTQDKINFITFIITEFASAYKMNVQNAYLYLRKFGGMDFIYENWWALHTENPWWAVQDIYEICLQNGGKK